MVRVHLGRLVKVAAPVGVAVVTLALIAPTVMRAVGFWDTAEFQTVGPALGVAHPTGFPAYVTLGWLASIILQPLGDAAFRMNLLSAILVAVAAGATVVLVRRLTGSTLVGVAAGLGLALTPLAWRIGTSADAHALHLALVPVLLVVLVEWGRRERAGEPGADRWLIASAAVYGVAAANHSLALLFAPAIALYLLAVDPGIWRRVRLIGACAATLLAVLVVLYLELPLRGGPFRAPLVYGRPETLDGFRYIVLAEQFRGSLVDPLGNLGGKLADLVNLTVRQFGPLAVFVPIGLLATIRREPAYALLTGVAAALTLAFASAYVNADIGRYYLGPVLIAWTWLAILAVTVAEELGGVLRLTDDRRRTALAGLLGIALLVPTAVALPRRAVLLDRSGDVAAARWLDAALAAMEPDAVVVSWWSFSTTLWYAQHIEGRFAGGYVVDDRTRLDAELGDVDDVIDSYLGRRPVYVIREDAAELDALRRRYELEATGASQLLRVVGSLGTAR